MRPLNRGARNAYPYNINMASMATLTGSLQNYTLAYNQAAVTNVIGANPDMEDQLDYVWLTVTKAAAAQIVAPANLPARTAAKPRIVERNGDEYRRSANDLIANMGRFCAYCEKPNPSPLAVEHMVPKDNFPLFSLSWTNFLLTCTVCNTAGTGKGTGPSRATVVGWGGGAPADELGYFTRCRNRYLWPDMPAAYQDLTPRLEYFSISTNAWQPVPAAESVRWGIVELSNTYATREVRASIFLDATAQQYARRVRVRYVPANAAATRAQTYFGLDQPGGGGANPTTSDGREFDRTRAWLAVVGDIGALTVLPLASWANYWAYLPTRAANLGHFSVWVRVLDQLNMVDQQNPPQTILDRFLATCVGATGFPGTDLTQVP
ncbi:hypothetical protein [Cellulomonas phragmiteti]|uniref:HNH nuclease domain-containing protein n=1 Tax=Cellulomonas phragmiteti TaxID=478780 RepID=A0ABQ4DIU1_9CELL|nr:hypothetical protein [Cellulomonas phragmiteti]GIG39278.1 hypothetical protein Cph01nite_10400 [Cellulomonas phragmiteti]